MQAQYFLILGGMSLFVAQPLIFILVIVVEMPSRYVDYETISDKSQSESAQVTVVVCCGLIKV